MVDVFTKLQIRRWSNRFDGSGGRWGARKINPNNELELAKRRARNSEAKYLAQMDEVLGTGFIDIEVEAAIKGVPPEHPVFGYPERK